MNSDDFTQFPKSTPWGYYPLAVEEKINQYETIIKELNDRLLEKRQDVLLLNQKIETLQNELREMHLQMASMELPDTTEVIENQVLNEFKNYNTKEELPKNKVKIEIVKNDKNKYKKDVKLEPDEYVKNMIHMGNNSNKKGEKVQFTITK